MFRYRKLTKKKNYIFPRHLLTISYIDKKGIGEEEWINNNWHFTKVILSRICGPLSPGVFSPTSETPPIGRIFWKVVTRDEILEEKNKYTLLFARYYRLEVIAEQITNISRYY